jgi:hypothetical protein
MTKSPRTPLLVLLAFAGSLLGSAALVAAVAARRPRAVENGVQPVGAQHTAPVQTTLFVSPPLAPAKDRRAALRGRLAALWTLAALALFVFSAVRFQMPGADKTTHPLALLALVMGVAAFGGAAYYRPPARPTVPAASAPLARVRFLPLIGGAALLVLVGEMSAQLLRLPVLMNVSQHVQVALFVAGVAGVAWGLSGRASPPNPLSASREEGHGAEVRWWQREWVIVALITVLAFGLRVWNVEDAIRVPIDETHMMNAVADLRDRDATPMMQPFHWAAQFSWLYPYMQSRTVALFGGILGLRITSVIVGTLWVPAVYLLARALYDHDRRRWWECRVSLAAALLMATFPPQLQFSRLGLINVADALFATLAFASFARGLRGGGRYNDAVAGVMLGLTQYFYEGGRLLYPAVMLGWIALLVAWRVSMGVTRLFEGESHAPGWRLEWRRVATMGAAAALVALPFYYTWFGIGMAFAPKLNYFVNTYPIPHTPGSFFETNIQPVLLHFISLPDSGHFYGGNTPMLLVYAAPFFFVGLASLLWRYGRSPGSPLLAMWLAGTIAGTSLILANSWTARFVVVFPALVLLVALGIDETARGLVGRPQRVAMANGKSAGGTGITRRVLPLVAAAVLALAQGAYYFGTHLEVFNVQAREFGLGQGRDYFDVYYRARLLPPGTPIYLLTPLHVHPDDFGFYNRFFRTDIQIHRMYPDQATVTWLRALHRRDGAGGYALFFLPEDDGLRGRIREALDADEMQYSPYNVPLKAQYGMIYIPPETTSP